MQLGNFIKERREELGLTQAELADTFNLSTGQFISNWERGHSYPPAVFFKKLSKVLKVEPMQLVELRAKGFVQDFLKRAKL